MKRSKSVDKALLQMYPKAIVHMRRQHQELKLGLILGAGVSTAFGMPTWNKLLDKLASDEEVRGNKVTQSNDTLTAKAELLYRHFVDHRRRALSTLSLDEIALMRKIKGEWYEIIRKILYEDLPDRDHLDKAHPYLGEFLKIISTSPLTVNYNFDSCIEMMLSAYQKRNKESSRLYETVFDGALPFRSQTGVIYHPNGYLPENVLDGFSDDLVFSEQSFGDQLLDTVMGRYYSLGHHLSKNTCLFLGISFSDETLKHLLRRSAIINPGHYHYCVYWLDPLKKRRKSYETALARYRFEVYNLITLFLKDDEIAALGRLLSYDYDELQQLAENSKTELTWIYYLSGIPGIGKTSVTRYMQSLSTYDEWLEDPPDLLNRPFTELSTKEQEEVDEWIARQFALKNERLEKEREGIFLIDRALLDPLSFTKQEELADKAKWYSTALRQGDRKRSLRSGRVILLKGDTKEIASRLSRRKGEIQEPQYLDQLQERFEQIYSSNGVQIVPTYNLSLMDLVKMLARIIHYDSYTVVDLELALQSIQKGTTPCSTLNVPEPKVRKRSTLPRRSSAPRSKRSTKK